LKLSWTFHAPLSKDETFSRQSFSKGDLVNTFKLHEKQKLNFSTKYQKVGNK